MSFTMRDRDEKGILTFTGSSDAPSREAWALVLALGSLFISSLTAGGVMWLVRANLLMCFLGLLTALLFGGVIIRGSIWWLRLCEEIRHLTTLEDLCRQMGWDEIRLRHLTQERGILPHCRINGRDFYDPKDFGGMATLLRPADTRDTLLRPSLNAGTPLPLLLRPSADRSSTAQRDDNQG
jgi:hypothetical protein